LAKGLNRRLKEVKISLMAVKEDSKKEVKKTEIKWIAPEFEYFAKDISWYWLVIIVGIIVIAIALWNKNFLFAIFVIIATLLILSWGKQKPREVEFTLDEHGLDIEKKKFYPYSGFAGFAVRPPLTKDEESTDLVFKFKARFRPYFKIQIKTKDTEKFKKYTNQYLPEIEYEESIADHIAKILKF